MDEISTWEKAFKEWSENNNNRDKLIRDAHASGITKHRIHLLTGLARTTIDRILNATGKKES